MQDQSATQRDTSRVKPHYAWGFTATGLFALLAMAATPAFAVSHMRHLDVSCGSGLTLHRASEAAQGVKTYDFGGVCTVRTIYDTGPWGVGNPPVSANASWNPTTSTYTESLHLLAAQTFEVETTRGESFTAVKRHRVGTSPEEATFKCDVDPVVNKAAHCTLVSQHNGTGWGGQGDGFAWSAAHNRPLLAGVVSAAQVTAAAKHTAAAYPPIQCRDLRLTDASASAKGSYKFNGTCQLYHTADGSQGLQATHVMVNGSWNATARQAKEGVMVLAPAIEGGGSWSTTYTCNDDPWRNAHAQCSKTAQLGHESPVYNPITDLIDRHPVAMGMAHVAAPQPMHVPDAPKSRLHVPAAPMVPTHVKDAPKSPMHFPDAPKSPMHVPDAPKPGSGSGSHSLNPQPEPPSSKSQDGKAKQSGRKQPAASQKPL